MTEPDAVDLDDAAITLAARLAHETLGFDGATIVTACCWIMAERIRQAECQGADPTHAMTLLLKKTCDFLGYLRWVDHAGDTDVTRH